MGPSGCGKSTVLALAGGIEEPDSGIVRLHGSELRRGTAERVRRLREEVGYVFQELNLLRDLTALENVALPLELGGMDAGKARAASRDRACADRATPTSARRRAHRITRLACG